MREQLSPARQKLLATLAYVAVGVIAIAWVAINQAADAERQEQYAVKSAMLDGLKRQSISDAGKRLSPATDLDAATLPGPSETVAASALQRYLLDCLKSADGSVQSIQAEAKRGILSPGLRVLGAQLAFDASTSGLQRFLFAVETGLPFVFVDSLAVQPAPAAQPAARMGELVRVTLTVTSYWKAGEKTGGDP